MATASVTLSPTTVVEHGMRANGVTITLDLSGDTWIADTVTPFEDVVYDDMTGSTAYSFNSSGWTKGQSFKVATGGYYLYSVQLYTSSKDQNPSVPMRFGTTSNLTSYVKQVSLSGAGLVSGGWSEWVFEENTTVLAADTTYYIAFGAVTGGGIYIQWNSTGTRYPNGMYIYDNGATLWNNQYSGSGTDFLFKIKLWGGS